jgi:hypothetical protein
MQKMQTKKYVSFLSFPFSFYSIFLPSYPNAPSQEDELDPEELRILEAIRKKKTLMRKEHALERHRGKVAPHEIKKRDVSKGGSKWSKRGE